jgi:hypothetical protein
MVNLFDERVRKHQTLPHDPKSIASTKRRELRQAESAHAGMSAHPPYREVDIGKIEGYRLSPSHPHDRYKARVFCESLEVQRRGRHRPRQSGPSALATNPAQ